MLVNFLDHDCLFSSLLGEGKDTLPHHPLPDGGVTSSSLVKIHHSILGQGDTSQYLDLHWFGGDILQSSGIGWEETFLQPSCLGLGDTFLQSSVLGWELTFVLIPSLESRR